MSESALIQRAQVRVGTTLRGKYRLDGVLGVGGMGVVYVATHRNAKRFAVKMLHTELSLNEDMRNRFLREGYAANMVGHAGTVAVLDDDVTEDGAAFLVMELLDGLPVDVWAKNFGGRLPLLTAVAIVDQLLDVLAVAHEKGIIHRDIKPANLFVVRDGMLKVLDFGIARARDAAGIGGASRTATGKLLGTPGFMAPEQALAQSSEVDARTDLWAVGATLFTLASGELVHEGENGALVLIHAATRAARSFSSVSPEAPAALAAVVDRSLPFAKDARWPNAAAMRDALRSAYGSEYGVLGSRIPVDRWDALPHYEGGPVGDTERATDGRYPPSAIFGHPSTAKPVQAAPRASSAPRIARWSAVAVAGLIALAGFVGMRVARLPATRGASDSPEGSGASPEGSPDAPESPTRAPVHASLDPQGSRAAAAGGAPEAATETAARAPADAPDARVPSAPGLRSTPPTGPRTRPAPRPTDCVPPYFFDAQGNRIFRKECF